MTASTKLKWAPNYQQDIDKINTKLKHYYDFYNRMVQIMNLNQDYYEYHLAGLGLPLV